MLSAAAGLALAGASAGCQKEEDVRAYAAPKDTPAPASAGGVTATNGSIQWDVPEGWTSVPGDPMRHASFAVDPADPTTVVTVMRLPSSPLLANVNRWEGQIGLPPTSADKLDTVVTHVDTAAGHVDFVDLIGPEQSGKPRQRTLAAILAQGDSNWFFKLTGPDATVGAQKPKFDAFVRSVRFGGAGPAQATGAEAPKSGELPAGHPPIGGNAQANAAEPAGPAAPVAAAAAPAAPAAPAAAQDGKGTPGKADGPISEWVTPAGWAQDPAGGMRVLSFKAKGDGGVADVSIIPLPADVFGSAKDQVNRWRGQVGLPPADQINEKGDEQVKIGGKDAPLFDLAGKEQRILAAYVQVGDRMWFFKMTGPTQLVGGQKDAFKQFVSSVKFAT